MRNMSPAHSSPIPRSHSPIHFKNHSPPTTPKPAEPSSNDNAAVNSPLQNSSTPRLKLDDLVDLLNQKAAFVSFTVDHEDFENSTLQLLRLVFPEWFSASNDHKHLKLAQCTDGITNKLMKCKNLATGQVVLIRAYGKNSELIIDRQAELLTFSALQENGLAPPLHARFNNGFIYGYVPGIPLKPSQLSCPSFYPLVARKMARWHRVDCVPGDRNPRLFKTIWKWFRNIPSAYSQPDVQARFTDSIDIPFLESTIKRLETRVKSMSCPVTFCHNDLLSANIIYNPEDKDVAFIDYEYGSFNYRSFDIANHFCEFGGFDCDYSLYPDEQFQRNWIKEYLEITETEITESNAEIDQIVIEVEVFTLISHAFWVLWALVQAQVSDIPFDYMGYAVFRFIEFKRRAIIFDRHVQ